MPHYLHFARQGEVSLLYNEPWSLLDQSTLNWKGPIPFSFLLLVMAVAWVLIRKTQNHIITLDETKEDNPIVCLAYVEIEFNYTWFLTMPKQSFQEMPQISLKQMYSHSLIYQRPPHWSISHAEVPHGLDHVATTAEKTKQINTLSIPYISSWSSSHTVYSIHFFKKSMGHNSWHLWKITVNCLIEWNIGICILRKWLFFMTKL